MGVWYSMTVRSSSGTIAASSDKINRDMSASFLLSSTMG